MLASAKGNLCRWKRRGYEPFHTLWISRFSVPSQSRLRAAERYGRPESSAVLPHRRHDFSWPFLCYIEDRGFRRCGTLLASVFDREIASHSRIGGTSSLGLFIGLFLISFAAAAAAEKVYPVSGIWTAIDTDFPTAASETCLAVKTFGVEAVSRKSVSEMIIFAKDKRYDVQGDVQTETTIKSIKMADGGFWITESFSKRRWFGFKRKTTYFLSVIDPQTIQIRDARGMTRYAKCGPHDRQSKADWRNAIRVNSQFHSNSRN
jgi:hypothetical protein